MSDWAKKINRLKRRSEFLHDRIKSNKSLDFSFDKGEASSLDWAVDLLEKGRDTDKGNERLWMAYNTAVAYIDKCPSDPDIFPDQWAAWNDYLEAKAALDAPQDIKQEPSNAVEGIPEKHPEGVTNKEERNLLKYLNKSEQE